MDDDDKFSATSEDSYILSEEEEDTQAKKKYCCEHPGCGKEFKKPSLLSQHVLTHTGERAFACDECAKTFLRPYHLKRHKLSVHKDKSEFRCTFEGCKYVTNINYNLNRHIKRNHETDLPFKCSFDGCKKAFKKHKSLYFHEATHNEGKPFKCTYEGCDKSFTKFARLNNHLSIHKKEKVYQCSECGKIFKAAWRLNKHKEIHLENRVLFKCPVDGCEKEYTEQKNVLAHMRIHHGDKEPLKCPDENCGQTFVYKASLTRHLKNHDQILKTYRNIAKSKKRKEKKKKEQKRLHSSAASKLSGYIHELGDYLSSSDIEVKDKAINDMCGGIEIDNAANENIQTSTNEIKSDLSEEPFNFPLPAQPKIVSGDEHDHIVSITFDFCSIPFCMVLGRCRPISLQYKENEEVVVWMNTVGPYHNRQETYEYFSLPFCKGTRKTISHYHENLGEALQGVELEFSGLDIAYKKDVAVTRYCQIILDKQNYKALAYAVQNHYWYQMYIDDLPVWGIVGEIGETDDELYIWTHKKFEIGTNVDKIVDVNLTSEAKVKLEPGITLAFTYQVKWKTSQQSFANRYEKYLDPGFFQHRIHWFSIFNSFMMVIFLVGLVSMILMRTLRKDYARYSKEEDLDEMVCSSLLSLFPNYHY
eukprot:gene7043-7834_t